MPPYEIRITKQAKKEIEQLTPKLRQKLRTILVEIIAPDPHSGKQLVGDLAGNYSYRLNYKDRIVYSIDEANHIVYIKRVRTHYGD